MDQTDTAPADNLAAAGGADEVTAPSVPEQRTENAEAFRRDQAIFRRETIAKLLELHKRVKDLELKKTKADEGVVDCRGALTECQQELAEAHTALEEAEAKQALLEQQLEQAHDDLHSFARISSSVEHDVLALLGKDAEPR